MKHLLLSGILFVFALQVASAQLKPSYNLVFDTLPGRWDEALPLGNGQLGVLVWQKNGALRLSLDRADLWDDRPMPDIDKLTFDRVIQKVREGNYEEIQRLGDLPYETYPAPTKLPGAALEFNLRPVGAVQRAELDLKTATALVRFESGITFKTFVHASQEHGFFEWNNLPAELIPELIPPNYNTGRTGTQGNSVDGQGLERLGYTKGKTDHTPGNIRYRQPIWGGGFYEVAVRWTYSNQTLRGTWTISNSKPARPADVVVSSTVLKAHLDWWDTFWNASSIAIPNTLLERQYYLETYKLGCVARTHTPAITLQAVWTADNGSLPPWKGDFHHDLNTQLSYWPTYSGNRLAQAASFTNWLWETRKEAKKYTRQYFQAPGWNVPGVTTITGKPMGGWIQYSMSPTISAWLSQHFYWEWKYGMDLEFLRKRAYPWIHQTAVFLEHITRLDSEGVRQLPLSSSPEFHDNSIKAWFPKFTNHDLALTHYAFKVATEVAEAMGKTDEARHWQLIRAQLPAFDQNETGLTIAPGQNLTESHRHHAHVIGIYPMGILNPDLEADRQLILQSLQTLETQGTRAWTGYSFSWLAALYAQARDAEGAAEALRIFASNFVSSNSFHLNGDQKGGQYSSFTYRPFTLEGNFAFAQGIHEMLLQSNKGYIEVFPATPAAWQDASFENLRAEGAFLVSAKKEGGTVVQIELVAEKGGIAQVKLPQRSAAAQMQRLTLRAGEKKVLLFDTNTQTWNIPE